MENATVDLLIDADTWSWNLGIIDGLFAPNDVDLIKRIPLTRLACADEMFWPFTQHGNYTCKSGYRFLKELHDGPPRGEEQLDRSFWRKVWMRKVPNKIKNFVWRACKDSIPTKVNLRRRSIPVHMLCDRCSVEEETCLHALWSCKELDQVWSGLSGWGQGKMSCFVDFCELLSWILDNHAQPKLFAMTVWTVRNQRN